MGVLTFAALSYVLRTLYRRLDRLGIFDDARTNEAQRATAWIESLRGIAALGVVSSHLATCLAPSMFEACCSGSSTYPSIFQLPPLRILAAGHSWLALFFLLSGFVSALGPLHLAQAGRVDTALSSLGRAALKRPLRFVLPAALVTCVSWVVCHCGGYVAARRTGRFLLATNSPERGVSVLDALRGLGWSLVATWRWPGPENQYENMQYALVWMLQGSYLVYGVLLATVAVGRRARVLVTCCILFLSIGWSNRILDPLVGPAYLGGVLLAEFWTSTTRVEMERYSKIVTPLLGIVGIVLMAWPKNRSELLLWSTLVRRLVVDPLPHVLDAERLVGTIGASSILAAVMISSPLRQKMSHPFLLWLGRISFAVYLLHMILLRTMLPWLLFLSNPIKALFLLDSAHATDFQELLVSPNLFRKIFGVFVVLLSILTAAHQWSRLVEPRIQRAANRVEALLTGEQSTRHGTEQALYNSSNGTTELPVFKRTNHA